VTLFLGGDVMTGRGIDQVLPRPSSPRLHEAYVGSALGYVELAERAHGRISRPVTFSYVWGDLLSDLERRSPDLRIVNLETSVTTSEEALPKGINYRMHPANVPCLAAAKIDCCVLANNHVLDWGTPGLRETLEVLATAEIATAGAGRSAEDAERPAVLDTSGKGRVLVFGFGMPSSGIPHDWAAAETRPGVNLLPDSSPRSVSRAVERIGRWRRPGDRIVASIHWGGNWGYDVPREERELAHRLIEGGVDVVHGHSSHHPKGIEVYEGRLVLYGCGDLLNDYEGISGQEEFRGDLVLAYLAALDPSGRLTRLDLLPYRIRRFRLERAAKGDTRWLRDTLDRDGRALGTAVELAADGSLTVSWR
jgi:poly-gamma-glutamate synthesis protein (capsule biosynthesis protein)